MKYRIKFYFPFYAVQEQITVGWSLFSYKTWITVESYWNLRGAEQKYKELTNNEK